jgi:hypothetical protein
MVPRHQNRWTNCSCYFFSWPVFSCLIQLLTSKNACVLQWDLESITGLLVARKSIDTLDTRGFEINYYVMFLNWS